VLLLLFWWMPDEKKGRVAGVQAIRRDRRAESGQNRGDSGLGVSRKGTGAPETV